MQGLGQNEMTGLLMMHHYHQFLITYYDEFDSVLSVPEFKSIFKIFCRQFSSAVEDLKEALKLAPSNRELQRLLTRVRDECTEQARYENLHGSQSNVMDRGERRAEETAL